MYSAYLGGDGKTAAVLEGLSQGKHSPFNVPGLLLPTAWIPGGRLALPSFLFFAALALSAGLVLFTGDRSGAMSPLSWLGFPVFYALFGLLAGIFGYRWIKGRADAAVASAAAASSGHLGAARQRIAGKGSFSAAFALLFTAAALALAAAALFAPRPESRVLRLWPGGAPGEAMEASAPSEPPSPAATAPGPEAGSPPAAPADYSGPPLGVPLAQTPREAVPYSSLVQSLEECPRRALSLPLRIPGEIRSSECRDLCKVSLATSGGETAEFMYESGALAQVPPGILVPGNVAVATVQARQLPVERSGQLACDRLWAVRTVETPAAEPEHRGEALERRGVTAAAYVYLTPRDFLNVGPMYYGRGSALAALDSWAEDPAATQAKLASFPRPWLSAILRFLEDEGGGSAFAGRSPRDLEGLKSALRARAGKIAQDRVLVGRIGEAVMRAHHGPGDRGARFLTAEGTEMYVTMGEFTADLSSGTPWESEDSQATVYCARAEGVPPDDCYALAVDK
ncbi:MAG: hypothetical protein LBW85_06740 [Deltaproteobacteria bacterium]|jgi:hypothetical protein|nr:hypothetical protein [Deltaproteobacteria bacterium]